MLYLIDVKFNKALIIGIDKASLSEESWKKIDKLCQKKIFVSKDNDQIKKQLIDTDCLLVAFGVSVTKEDIDNAPKLKYIGTLATAFGKVDIDYAKKKKILVCNLAGYSTESVAEFIIATILESIRGLEAGKSRARKGNYSEMGIKATEIKSKVFAVLGLGSIGGRVAQIAKGFDADVRYWSKNRKKSFEVRGVRYQDADKLISQADFISINLAQNSETNNFLNAKRIQNLKRGAVVVNTTPLELVDIDALTKRLQKNDITFILDHSDEMSRKDLKKLSKFKNCIIYPPMAYISDEARIAKQEIFITNIEDFLNGKPTNVVN